MRKTRSDGERSRSAILNEAARLATVEGIDGLSIGRLAEAVGMSKSGLFAHFRSKEELQLATIDTAGVLFAQHVVDPALTAATAFERLRGLAENFLKHVEDDVFPGGCFFASVAAELDTRPGPVRDRAIEVVDEWTTLLESTVRDAQAEGAIVGVRGCRAARLRARRIPAARERALRDQRRPGGPRPGTARDRAPARGRSSGA